MNFYCKLAQRDHYKKDDRQKDTGDSTRRRPGKADQQFDVIANTKEVTFKIAGTFCVDNSRAGGTTSTKFGPLKHKQNKEVKQENIYPFPGRIDWIILKILFGR